MPDGVTIGGCRLVCGRAEDVLPTLPDASVNLICTDPPYMGQKLSYLGEKVTWDRQWPTHTAYLAWLKALALEWRRVLTPNGSLYVFASSQMAAHVEVMLGEVFQVLSHIVWVKHDGSGAGTGGHSKVCKEDLMSYFPQTERILFCEQYGSDAPYQETLITENASYWTACESAKASLFGTYFKEEFARAGVTQKDIARLFPSATGGLTGCVSNWLLGYNIPTRDQYDTIRTFLNTRNCRTDYLRREYEDLRREYEDLRREYEDLRRPFTVSPSVPYTDCWTTFPTVQASISKHPCEKPLSLYRHIVMASSRPGDVCLDCCAGSFAFLDAARQCGRRGIGIEQDHQWWQKGCQRLSQVDLFEQAPVAPKPVSPHQLTLT